jgi:hypothetical protein
MGSRRETLMSWVDAVANRTTIVDRDDGPAERGVFSNARRQGWDPYEVWLTRVKQARDSAPTFAVDGAQSAERRA